MKKLFIRILLILLLQFFIISGLWAIDIGASGMVWESVYGQQGQVQGLGFVRSASNQYHLGLGIVYLTFFVQTLWLIRIFVKEEKK